VAKGKAKAPPKSVDELVLHALKLAATNPKAKWSGASATALFNTKEPNTEAAIAECINPDAPLLRQEGAVGVLTAAGFERVAGALPAEEVGAITKAMAAGMPAAERVVFLQDAIRRTPNAAAELTPLLEEATAAKDAEQREADAKFARETVAKAANEAALVRALELIRQDKQNDFDSVLRRWEALGQKPDALPVHPPRPRPEPEQEPRPERKQPGPGPEPKTAEEKDFRRSECDRLAAAWRDALAAGKLEGAEFLETAMWNIRGMRMIGETDAKVKFDGRIHESDGPAFTDYAVKVVRPGWLLKTDDEEYVALKAAVTPV
jgi:hypothetical protein